MESFGRYLRNEREARSVSIDDISSATKISPSQLRALEADDLAALPNTPYVKGFIKAYSRYLNIDPNDALLRFENYLQEIEQEDGAPSVNEFPVAGFKRDTPHLGLVVAAGGIILLLIVILIVLVRACGGGEETTFVPAAEAAVTPVSQTMQAAPEPAPPVQTVGEVFAPLPTVPPDSFRVRRIAPPPPTRVLAEHQPPDDSAAGGGSPGIR